jgi:hypothetical protein
MALAMASGLARPAAGALHGFPESRPRPVTDPAALVDDEGPRAAAGALLRIVRRDWVSLPRLSEALRQRCPVVFAADQGLTWADRELVWLRRAADVLHRVGVLEGERGPEGLLAVRRAGPGSARSPGFLLTPDREILVAPGELHSADYGRLCRLAPYVDGDVLHRHRLTREGLAADLAAGHDDAAAWLLAKVGRQNWASSTRRNGATAASTCRAAAPAAASGLARGFVPPCFGGGGCDGPEGPTNMAAGRHLENHGGGTRRPQKPKGGGHV